MGLAAKRDRAAVSLIGEVELDLGRYELRRSGRRVKLEKKPMELLIFLAGRREQLVSRQTIVDQLWPADPLIDTERNLNNIVRKIRTALGDDAARPRFLETVVGKGYRFIGPVRVIPSAFPAPGLPGGAARSRASSDAVAQAEFLAGLQRSSSGDPKLLAEATEHLMNAVARDPEFALAHAKLSFVCASRRFEFDPSRSWLEKSEFHCRRALELDPALPEAHVARAFLLWGPSKNFQHLEAIAELKHALALEKNLPHAYNRLGTILAHIGLLDHARAMYERGGPFTPQHSISHSIAQVYLWSGQYDLARHELERWRAENPASKYALPFALQLAIVTGNRDEAGSLLNEATTLMPEEPLIISLRGVVHAASGEAEPAMQCIKDACTNPKSFGHAHHTYYQIACILSLLDRPEAAFEWLERSVDTGFACWPFFLRDPSLENLRRHPQFELLLSSLHARYPEELGVL